MEGNRDENKCHLIKFVPISQVNSYLLIKHIYGNIRIILQCFRKYLPSPLDER